ESQGKHTAAIDSFLRAIRIFRDANDISNVSVTFYNIGNAYYQSGDYQKALAAYQDSLAAATGNKDSEDMATAYVGMAFAYRKLLKDDLAVQSLLKAAELYQSRSNNQSLANVYDNLASIYYLQADYEQAALYYDKVLSLIEPTTEKVRIAAGYHN